MTGINVGTMSATFKAIVGALNALGKVDLVSEVFALQTSMIELQQKNVELTAEIRELKDGRAAVAALKLWRSAYWRGLSEPFTDGPFCTNCADGARKVIRLLPLEDHFWKCPSCSALFKLVEPPRVR